MLEAMFHARVGDDVFGEDPSINELENRMATMFGMESGLFCPSGTMSNQIAIKVHTQPGDEVICNELAHVYIYEGAGMAFNSGCQARPVPGDLGRINVDQVFEYISPNDPHRPHTSLICLENTSNRGGGSCYAFSEFVKFRQLCSKFGLGLHLDGARLFNAIVEKEEEPKEYGVLFDSISICLSKGLGCPVGTVLLGSQPFIQKARRVRKVFGGGMRQAGYLAAAGIYAMAHHIDRLGIDHQHARQIASTLKSLDYTGDLLPVETNIILFEVTGRWTPKSLEEHLKEHGIAVMAISPTQIRMVLHLDIDNSMVDRTCQILRSL